MRGHIEMMDPGTLGPGAVVRSVIVLENDNETRERLGAALPFVGYGEVRFARDAAHARELLDESVGAVLCDPCLEGALGVFDAALQLGSAPHLVALGSRECPKSLVFDLPGRGIRALIEKPVSAESIAHALSPAESEEELARVARAHVGLVGAKEAQAMVRTAMFQEALQRCGGNRHAAARMLRVDRRVVQIMFNTLQKQGQLELE